MSGSTETVDRTGETWLCDLPCPECGDRRVVGVLLVDRNGKHQHTRYVCTFWRQSGVPCGWEGWIIPGWDTVA